MLQYKKFVKRTSANMDNHCIIFQRHLESKLYHESSFINVYAYLRKTYLFVKSLSRPKSKSKQAASFTLRIPNKIPIFFWFAIIGLIFNEAWPSVAGLPRSGGGGKKLRKILDTIEKSSRCETIKIPQCKDVGYNYTDMKLSPANMVEQSDAAQAVKQFTLLFESSCAEEMKLLVCSIYAPICLSKYRKFLPPCRHICKRAKEGCGPLLAHYAVAWPELLRCKNYPEYSGNSQLCMHFNRTKSGLVTRSNTETLKISRVSYPSALLSARITAPPQLNSSSRKTFGDDHQGCYCRPPMVSINGVDDPLYNKVSTGSVQNCAFPCMSPYFDKTEQGNVQLWITCWSIVCFVVTLATVSTFLIDVGRFAYPERPIIFLSLCHMFVSMGFLIRVAAGREAVACGWGSDRALYHVSGPLLCSTSFLLVYFFGMAGTLWWVMLTLTWLLAAGLKWSNEAIANCATYFHIISWFIPALQSCLVLVTSSVDGDALSGICYVGNRDLVNLNRFVCGPLIVYLSLGGFFLFLGFINLFRIRTSIKKVGEATERLDKLMGRIGLFSLVYMTLASSLLGCQYYEHLNNEDWATSYNCNRFSSPPQLKVLMIKYLVNMLPGVATGLWICSGKTIYSWVKFYKQSCSCGPIGFVTWLKHRSMKCQQSDIETTYTKHKINSYNFDDVTGKHESPLLSLYCSATPSSRDDIIKYAEKSTACSSSSCKSNVVQLSQRGL